MSSLSMIQMTLGKSASQPAQKVYLLQRGAVRRQRSLLSGFLSETHRPQSTSIDHTPIHDPVSSSTSLLTASHMIRPKRYFSSSDKKDQVNNEDDPDFTLTILNETEDVLSRPSDDDLPVDRSLFTEEIPVRLPELTDDGHGKVKKWYKNEGDIVRYGDILCDIETSEFTFGLETDDEELAMMGKVFFDAPSGIIKANEVICLLLHKKEIPE